MQSKKLRERKLKNETQGTLRKLTEVGLQGFPLPLIFFSIFPVFNKKLLNRTEHLAVLTKSYYRL